LEKEHRPMAKCPAGLSLVSMLLCSVAAFTQNLAMVGHVYDSQRKPVSGAFIQLVGDQHGPRQRAITDRQGQFAITVGVGSYVLSVRASTFQPLTKSVTLTAGENTLEIQLIPTITHKESVVVTADVNEFNVLSPDPAEKVFVRQDLLDANPGRPGAPVSIPGYPIETASSGIKAPQYFAPGVAGDHGEPIAQYIAVGSYLVPNNLSANAHGNGYADPNIFIPEILESVQVDGGAYNVRQGNHSVNLAAIYGLRSRLDPFLTVTGDYRDIDAVAGFSPKPESFVAIEASYGNGFLKRLEHRQQYKLNGQRIYHPGQHQLTVLGIGYYGVSYVPGLVPIFAPVADFPNVGDTIDPRQHDQTHTALVALNDVWRLTGSQQFQLSGFFRTYNLALFSDFGQGLIRQSEFRTVAGQSTNYVNRFSEAFSLLAGLDYEREAPRRDNLDHYDFYTPGSFVYGPFTRVDSNNVTITSITPYAAGAGALSHFFRYYAGWRRDQIDVSNVDLINPGHSFQSWVGVNSPKATVSFIPKDSWFLPLVSASFGQAFFTEDPRIGMGTAAGTPVATAHSYQLVLSKTIEKAEVKVTLGHVTTSQELARLDPDTGLQEDEGPGLLKFLTVAVRRNFSQGSILATFSKADARDLDSGQPTPEAPRTIFDLLGNTQKLPFGLQARGEFEYVGKKPLGTGCEPDLNAQCTGTSVRELRGAVVRPFLDGRFAVGVNLLVASGYSGQTLENFAPSLIEDVVGVRIPSYASINVTYKFGRKNAP
jgi:Carboxypeptidase regulatory-like domain